MYIIAAVMLCLAFCAGGSVVGGIYTLWMTLLRWRFFANEDVWLTTTSLNRLIQDQSMYKPEDYHLRLIKAQDKRDQAQDWANFLNRYIP